MFWECAHSTVSFAVAIPALFLLASGLAAGVVDLDFLCLGLVLLVLWAALLQSCGHGHQAQIALQSPRLNLFAPKYGFHFDDFGQFLCL